MIDRKLWRQSPWFGSMLSGMDIRDLLNDDEFVSRVARATGIRTWADSGDLWHIDETNVDQVRVIDEDVREKAIEALREQLVGAFEGYELASPAADHVRDAHGVCSCGATLGQAHNLTV